MSLSTIVTKNLRSLERLVTTNSPIILTAAGVVGVVGTTVLTYKATVKTVRALDNDRFQRNLDKVTPGDVDPLTKVETIRLVGKHWLAPAAVGTLTVGAIVGAQYINSRRMAALIAGYMILEEKHETYREKAEEFLGKKKSAEVDEAIAQDIVNRAGDHTVTIREGDVLCIDALSNQVFSSNMEKMRKAENNINARINHGEQCAVTDLYAELEGSGLTANKLSDAFGWNEESMCEMKFTSKLGEAGEPYLVMDFSILPVPTYWKGKGADYR